MLHERPQVLVIAGLDPSGGAGIQADIQAITAMGCHPLPVISCLTVQDTVNVLGSEAVDAQLIRRQLQALKADCPIHAIKTGALGNAAVVQVLAEFLAQMPGVPLVLDPVIKAAGGGELADESLWCTMRDHLFPLADLLTPNGPELCQLGDSDNTEGAVARLMQTGCGAILATGGHGKEALISNRLYQPGQPVQTWQLPRVGGEYHGSGCTLAAAISAGMAKGQSLPAAIEAAQTFVAGSIEHALQVGRGQPVPDRVAR
ncbi:MAG: hydroxymethylpyrimidine/phosphomethylpyrimidine kinase [Halomonadaceae bacterium]|nr:MAG: hydroxymethylpyrimidine/phosphomethylpyrimidine kinase [Halomonadaceae bacterium]